MQPLEKIAKEIEKCKECKKDKFGLPVPGEGNSRAKIMFIGESPGSNEAKVGKPFVGRSGKFLTELLNSIGIKREDVFITSPVKYHQGKRNLEISEIKHGAKHLIKQIEVIKPKIIVLLGNVAIKATLDKGIKATENHGKLIEKKYFITFHPAAAIRFPKIKDLIKKDFENLKQIIKSL